MLERLDDDDAVFLSFRSNATEANATDQHPPFLLDDFHGSLDSSFDLLSSLQLPVWRVAIAYLDAYAVPLIVATGLAGNIVSLVVFVSRYMQPMSSSVYLAALSVADIGFLLSIVFFRTKSLSVVAGLCQIFTFVTYVSSFLSVWYVVGFTVERYLAVHFPLRRHVLCSKRTARLAVSGLAIASAVLYNFGMWTSGVMAVREFRLCAPLREFVAFLSVADAVDTVITFLLPIVVICVLNVRIAYTVVNFYRAREQLTTVTFAAAHHRDATTTNNNSVRLRISRPTAAPGHGAGSTASAAATVKSATVAAASSSSSASAGSPKGHQLRVTKLLLIVSAVFLVLNLPRHITRLYSLASVHPTNEVFLTCERLFQMVYYLHFSVNIFLYATVGGNNFRKAFARIWRRLRRQATRPFSIVAGLCLSRPSVQPSTGGVQHRFRVFVPLKTYRTGARNKACFPRDADSYN